VFGLVYRYMEKASVQEFRSQVSKNMGDYMVINGKETVISRGPYIVELYHNVLSSYARRNREDMGAISVWKEVKNDDGTVEYDIQASHVFETKDDAMNVYVDMQNSNDAEAFIEVFIKQYEEDY